MVYIDFNRFAIDLKENYKNILFNSTSCIIYFFSSSTWSKKEGRIVEEVQLKTTSIILGCSESSCRKRFKFNK